MIQGYEDDTEKKDPSNLSTPKPQQQPTIATTVVVHQQHLQQHGTVQSPTAPAAKRPKLSPLVWTTGSLVAGSPQMLPRNHAPLPPFRTVSPLRTTQMLAPTQIPGKSGGIPPHSISTSNLPRSLAISFSVQNPTATSTSSEVPVSSVSSSTNLTQLLLSDSPTSKTPSSQSLPSPVKSPAHSVLSQKLIGTKDVAMQGAEIANLLRQQTVPVGSGLVISSTDITSVHSYSRASASSSSSHAVAQHSGAIVKTEPKSPLPSPVTARTLPKRQRTKVLSPRVCEILARLLHMNITVTDSGIHKPKIIPTTSSSISSGPKIQHEHTDYKIRYAKLMKQMQRGNQVLRAKHYTDHIERYFLKVVQGDLLNFPLWLRKLPLAELTEYLKTHRYPGIDTQTELQMIPDIQASYLSSLPQTDIHLFEKGASLEQKSESMTVANEVSSHSQTLAARLLATAPVPSIPKNPSSLSSPSVNRQQAANPKHAAKHNSLSAVYDSSIGSQEEIVERAKQEAYVMQRIGDLRKEGLWSLKKLPKIQEASRSKGHWDYLLEEMAWLATDFIQERKWKKAAAKKCSRMILKYFQEKEMRVEKAEKEQNMRLRRIASFMAKEIRSFWTNIEKLVEYKQQTWLDARKKKVLDSHLNFIMDQTEKYSSWLTQGLNRQILESTGTSREASPSVKDLDNADEESGESDTNETIEQEESVREGDVIMEEIVMQESELTLENLLNVLPKEVSEKPALALDPNDRGSTSRSSRFRPSVENKAQPPKNGEEEDEEFQALSSEEDDEETIREEEEKEETVDHARELKDLEDDNTLSIEALLEKYNVGASDYELEESVSSLSEDEGMDISDNERSNMSGNDTINTSTVDNADASSERSDDKNPSKEINDIAATAESFQPKGNTLSTTQVCTKIPFLLKHQLREYQHIGLDWLNAMYEKKLNGILADEMGLGKTIQTISILAHLACEKGIWGPHLIVVPTSVMLNWEMEIKKWCPAFKILTYYGSPKERKQKRIGWTKPNTFHICITSYKLVVQDHASFRRKKWVYFILDEAQHIKNFKSQRWQMLLNFQSTHRLLLTGTPLQNNLMELWSLMHFLMPNVFQSHRDFREWFVNPVTGMIEGNHEYNDHLIKRLHKVLRPFLLRRLKCEVEKQLPKKYEHVVICRLSKRQRYLYDDFMAQTKTKETLATGNFMSVINILMQLRKVCNHPNMFDPRPITSPFMMSGVTYNTASLVPSILDYNPLRNISLCCLNLNLADIEMTVTAFAAHRVKKFQMPPSVFELADSMPDPPPPVPAGKLRLTFTGASTQVPAVGQQRHLPTPQPRSLAQSNANRTLPPFNTSLMHPQRYMALQSQPNLTQTTRALSPVAAVNSQQLVGQSSPSAEYTLQLLQQSPGSLPVAQLAPIGNQMVTSAPFTVQIPAGARMPLSIGRLVQTSSGQHLLITPSVPTIASESQSTSTTPALSTVTMTTHVAPTTNVAMAAVLPQIQKGIPSPMQTSVPNLVAAFTRPQNPLQTSSTMQNVYNKPIGRVAPMNIQPPQSPIISGSASQTTATKQAVLHSVTRSQFRPKFEVTPKAQVARKRISPFHLERLVNRQYVSRIEKLRSLGRINYFRCGPCPVYGPDLIEAVTVTRCIKHWSKSLPWGGQGYINCLNASSKNTRCRQLSTEALTHLIDTPETCLFKLIDIIKKFVFVTPPVAAPCIRLHVSHPPPSKLHSEGLWIKELSSRLLEPSALIHPIVTNQTTQFPELRLIEYDCGKLQRLSHLLYDLKSNHHRALIFTQMTRMLDILEQFLSHHGHTYLRLDGNTKIEMRQLLMERFNADNRIFCFILSTRSGGIGVNLTGADTVIFYDSDWNPTMDAQAQDRCHRIGQTRDVHIYRLISERTIEENILKKANQKRMLGDLAIEGGNFTTAFFKKNTLHELFGLESLEDSLKVEVAAASAVVATVVGASAVDATENVEVPENFSQVQFEQALGMCEEENDLQAAKVARDEAAAELAEFDETIPFDNDSRENEERSPAEEELDRLMEQLTPIERYAVRFFESLQDPVSLEQLKQAEEEIEAQKRDWELDRLKALQEEQERRENQEHLRNNDPLLHYGKSGSNQVSKTNSSSRLKRRSNNTSKQTPETPTRRSTRITGKKENHGSDHELNDSELNVNHHSTKKPKLDSSSRNGNAVHKITNGPSKHFSESNFGSRNVGHNNEAKAVKVNSSPIVKPFPNPNLVIRTRRASAIEAEEKNDSERSMSSPKGAGGSVTFESHLSTIIAENQKQIMDENHMECSDVPLRLG